MSYKVAAAQFCASSNIQVNLENCLKLISEAKEQGSCAIFFPEASDFIANNNAEAKEISRKSGCFITKIREEAFSKNISIGIGFHEKIENMDQLYNTYLYISNEGNILGKYRKIHLFDVDMKDGPSLKESKYTKEGDSICPPIATPFGLLGLMICYDIRFPEISQTLRLKGAQILTYPSVFTVKTGQAHWETLIRARAIETQCYVIAPGQVGEHNSKRSSYGNTMIVSPWGEILSQCGNRPGPLVCCAEIDLNYLEGIRKSMPVENHRKPNTYFR